MVRRHCKQQWGKQTDLNFLGKRKNDTENFGICLVSSTLFGVGSLLVPRDEMDSIAGTTLFFWRESVGTIAVPQNTAFFVEKNSFLRENTPMFYLRHVLTMLVAWRYARPIQ